MGTAGPALLDVNELAALPPGMELDAAIDALLEDFAERASRLDDLCEELYELVAPHDPVQTRSVSSDTCKYGSDRTRRRGRRTGCLFVECQGRVLSLALQWPNP